MDAIKLIKIEALCKYYEIPQSFIDALDNYDLIEITYQSNEKHLDVEHIVEVEKFMRLHYDLKINFEGLDVVSNLLQQIEEMQKELISLRNKVNFLE